MHQITMINPQGGDSTRKLTGGPGLEKKITPNCSKIGLTQSAACSSYVKIYTYLWCFDQDFASILV